MSRIESWLCCRPALLTTMSRPPRPLDGVGHELLAERLAAQVARQGEADPALGLDQRDDLARVGLLVRQVVDGDVGALAGIGDGGGPAHAGVATGDQRLAPGEAARALVARLAVVRAGIHLAGQAGPGLGLPLERGPGIFRRRVLERLGCRLRRRALGEGRRGDRTEGQAEPGGAANHCPAGDRRRVVRVHGVAPLSGMAPQRGGTAGVANRYAGGSAAAQGVLSDAADRTVNRCRSRLCAVPQRNSRAADRFGHLWRTERRACAFCSWKTRPSS